ARRAPAAILAALDRRHAERAADPDDDHLVPADADDAEARRSAAGADDEDDGHHAVRDGVLPLQLCRRAVALHGGLVAAGDDPDQVPEGPHAERRVSRLAWL